ncbi:hypothetical protein [Halococcoides cellulosivorans]|uniref:Uncharacterized protein n=1 Tax=Halococcoides cellulosivorans TaxID=1679096 RepID=A0A2R4X3W9_9EURY|nr:hypothetical protein [Halococcoides cellulosivorans]AWB28494.1 hypothetical protein HARCEL1_12680 [Halococcoides cellulosivorans]
MSLVERYRTRDDVAEAEISAERDKRLRAAFDSAEYGERIQDCVAATFEPDEPLGTSGVVLSSRLHHDRIFDLVSSFAAGSETDEPDEIKASATVVDVDSRERLSSHVAENRVLVSLRSEDTRFQAFRDYVLYLEQRLGVSLTPKLPGDHA